MKGYPEMSRKILITVLGLLIFACFSTEILADVIHLKDGRKIEGVIVSKDSKTVTIKTRFGQVEFDMSEVEKIEEKKTEEQLYEEMVKNTNAKDAAQMMKLVQWCYDNQLSSKAKKHLKEIISLDSNHAEARKLLGYVRYEGRWVTAKEKKKYEKEADRKKKEDAGLVEYNGEWIPKEDLDNIKKGLVRHEGKWVTAEEKERLEKNLVLYEGEWIPQEDVEKRKQGLIKIEGEWMTKEQADEICSDWETAWRLHSDHLTIRTNVSYDMAQKFLAEGESAYKTAKNFIGVEPNLKNGKLTIYLTADMETYNIVGNEMGDEKSSSYPIFPVEETLEDGSVSVTYCENPKDLRYTMGLIRHATIEQYCRKLDLKEDLPVWFVKGFATKEERFFHPKYITWSKAALIREGGPVKFRQFLDSFNYSTREIYHAGFLFSYLQSQTAPDGVKESLGAVIAAIKVNKKISNAFAKFQTVLIRAEKDFLNYVDKY